MSLRQGWTERVRWCVTWKHVPILRLHLLTYSASALAYRVAPCVKHGIRQVMHDRQEAGVHVVPRSMPMTVPSSGFGSSAAMHTVPSASATAAYEDMHKVSCYLVLLPMAVSRQWQPAGNQHAHGEAASSMVTQQAASVP